MICLRAYARLVLRRYKHCQRLHWEMRVGATATGTIIIPQSTSIGGSARSTSSVRFVQAGASPRLAHRSARRADSLRAISRSRRTSSSPVFSTRTRLAPSGCTRSTRAASRASITSGAGGRVRSGKSTVAGSREASPESPLRVERPSLHEDADTLVPEQHARPPSRLRADSDGIPSRACSSRSRNRRARSSRSPTRRASRDLGLSRDLTLHKVHSSSPPRARHPATPSRRRVGHFDGGAQASQPKCCTVFRRARDAAESRAGLHERPTF